MAEAGFALGYWGWWIIGIIFLFLELAVSGYFFLWMAFASLVVGIALYANPDLGWEFQILLFSGVSLASIVVFKLFQRRHPIETDQPALNRRGMQYIDRTFTLDDPIVNGLGTLRVDDTIWRISGADQDVGTSVRVVGVDGVILKVEPA